MLEIKKISKIYELGKKKDKNYQQVKALKNVSVNFRESEFVTILGQSGCGKTTLLNIIGGLDKYTSGDLVIDGKSTKHFTDKEWDNYRNKKIGFVFQSYNLIPHLSVFENVELALTLSGTSKSERKNKVITALKQVGLGDKIYVKPNQLSGGQMQRVAIARALINDPEIILADEPTGALDSKTSVQIMEILKEISKDKLIIMVSHNPELAEKYASRTIRLLDGEIQSDSNPCETIEQSTKVLNPHKKRMSFWTALSLSFKNLLTKKARTILVSIAGSIGIIGIALILALSSGFQGYVNKVQEDSLSSYPVIIERQSMNMAGMLTNFFMPSNETVSHDKDAIYSTEAITGMFNSVANATKPNDLKSFYAYYLEHESEIVNDINAVQLTYDIDFNTYNSANKKISPQSTAFYDIILVYSTKYFSNLANVNITQSGENYLFEGVYVNGEYKSNNTVISTYLPTELFDEYNSNDPKQVNLTETELVGIIDQVLFGSASAGGMGIGGTSVAMFKYYDIGVFNEMIDNETLIKSQYDLIAGEWNESANDVLLVLDANNEIDDYILYALNFITYEEMSEAVEKMVAKENSTMSLNYNDILNSSLKNFNLLLKTDFYDTESQTFKNEISLSPTELQTLINNSGTNMQITGIIRPNETATNACLKPGIVYSKSLTDSLITEYNTSNAVIDNNIEPVDLSNPSSISIYVKDFQSKKVITDLIETYNVELDEEDKGKEITYNDTVDIIMSSITTIISSITYVLIAFVSISLVVSSIMIGIITYISVLERIKEIGVLRSIGASKQDIKRVFTAESVIIGLCAGLLGIFITILLCIPINIIINSLAGLGTVAKLPIMGAVILILLSTFLTFIAGLLPARIASKKDPVIALRTE